MWSTIQGLGANFTPDMGSMLIDSAPPAIRICAAPARMRSAAMAMAWSPEEQKRLMVTPGTESGKPERNAAMRAMFMPDSASGMAQPKMTSSTSTGGTAGYLSSNARMTVAAKSSGRVLRSAPLGALPVAVRRQSTMTACIGSVLALVPQRLARFQHIPHALLGLEVPAKAQERFALEVQQILFGDHLFAGQPTTRQNIRQLFGNGEVVVADEFGLPRRPRTQFQQGQTAFARHLDVGAGRAGLVERHHCERESFRVCNDTLGIHADGVFPSQEAELLRVVGAG